MTTSSCAKGAIGGLRPSDFGMLNGELKARRLF